MPHPREQLACNGHESLERDVLAAWNSGRMPHAWLLTGTKGIGKATFAYRMARFVLAGKESQPDLFGTQLPATSLSLTPEHPLVNRMIAESLSDLFVLETPEEGKAITVDEVRKLSHFLRLTPSESLWKLVIIDSVDDLNRQAANALLKLLEEPPSFALILLISHSPFGLLPTIRSRCRVVKMHIPPYEQFEAFLREACGELDQESSAQLFLLSDGAPGLATLLVEEQGLDMYRHLLAAMQVLPSHPRKAWEKLVSLCSSEAKGQKRIDVLRLCCKTLCHRIACYDNLSRFFSQEEHQLLKHLRSQFRVPYWISLFERYDQWLSDCGRIHLDKSHVLLSMISDLEQRYHV